MSKSKAILQIIFLLFFGLIIGLIIAEIIAYNFIKAKKLVEKLNYAERKIQNNQFPAVGTFDKDLGWGLKPDSEGRHINSDYDVLYTVNFNGFRDKEIDLNKPVGEFRILALGESQVFGQGVNYGQRFSEAIEDCLRNTNIINMGIWGFGADQSLLQLGRDGLQFKPDTVILFVIQDFLERCKINLRLGELKPRFVLNDTKDDIVLEDMNVVRKAITTDNTQGQQISASKNEKNENTLLEKSSLFALLNFNKKMDRAARRLEEVDNNRWKTVANQLNNDMGKSIYSQKDFQALIFLLFKKYRDICIVHATDFIIVYIDPNKNFFDEFIKKPCSDLGISYLDLSKVLVQAANLKPLSFSIDPHYNAFTHKVIGEYVSDYLAKKYNLEKKKDYTYEFLGKFGIPD